MAKTKLYYNTVSPLLHESLNTLMLSPLFNPFRLVGGTALSLQRGHRKSEDIDLFTDAFHGTIDFDSIDTFLRQLFSYTDTSSIKEVGMGRHYTVGKSKDENIKLDIFYTDTFIQAPIIVDNIRMATVEEIIAMKLEVISRIGRKKDFWDIHELIHDYTLNHMLALHEMRYPYNHNAALIRENFTNFSEADKEPDPFCLRGKIWELIKLDIIDFIRLSNM